MRNEAKFLIGVILATLILIIGGVFIFGNQKGLQPSANWQQLLTGAKNVRGKAEAPVKIVEFADFQCPACRMVYPIVESILTANGEKVYLVFRHFPLQQHKNARVAGRAAEAAARQGKFWQIVDLLYSRQTDWAEVSDAQEIFVKYATELNLDLEKFRKDLDSANEPIDADLVLGRQNGVESTPTFFINGQKYEGVIPQDRLQKIIDDIK